MNIVMKKQIKKMIIERLKSNGIDVEDIDYIELSEEELKRGLKDKSVFAKYRHGAVYATSFGVTIPKPDYRIELDNKILPVREEKK